MPEKPQADYVGHPAMKNYAVSYQGPFQRPGKSGYWYKKMETWTEEGRDCGAWRWVASEEVPWFA
jgi:hypothetical protein